MMVTIQQLVSSLDYLHIPERVLFKVNALIVNKFACSLPKNLGKIQIKEEKKKNLKIFFSLSKP